VSWVNIRSRPGALRSLVLLVTDVYDGAAKMLILWPPSTS
jgi:hypothetical protein